MTCKELLDILKSNGEVNGVILDFPMILERLTDFQDYKWNIPVWYSIQLNRVGNIRTEGITKYKLVLREDGYEE